MGTPDSADPAVQHPAHGKLLRSGLRVDLHKDNFCLDLLQDLFDHQERIVGAIVHVAPANQVDDRNSSCFGVELCPSSARGLGRIVGGSDDLGAVVQIGDDFSFVERVVAHGDAVGAGVSVLILLRVNEEKKDAFKIIGLLYVIGVVAGMIINLVC